MMVEEIRKHLTDCIIPFWKGLRDDENGGYTGYMDYDLKKDEKAVKGCILNSRITWFFANAYRMNRFFWKRGTVTNSCRSFVWIRKREAFTGR